METVVTTMQYALGMAAGSAGMTALFLAGMVALWYNKNREHMEIESLFWYTVVTLVAVINPFYINAVSEYIPELYRSNMFLWILPTLPVILYTGVMAIATIKTKLHKLIFVLGMVLVLILAAATSYSQSIVRFTDKNYVESEKKDILYYVSASIDRGLVNDCMIWGDNDIMEYSRTYDGRIKTLYGKEYWEEENVNRKYADEYALMQSPAENIEKIAIYAKYRKCDYIIVSESDFIENEIPVPETAGSYYLEYTDETYLLYVYADYDRDLVEDNE